MGSEKYNEIRWGSVEGDQFNTEPFLPWMPEPNGAAHSSEIAYVFRNLNPNHDSKVTDEQEALSEIMA